MSPGCFRPCRYLHSPPWLLSTGATVVERASHPAERKRLSTAHLGIGSYKSAWLLLQKLRRAMVDPDRSFLQGIVEVDEASMPFRESGAAEGRSGPGRSAQGRILLAGAVELSENKEPRRIRLNEINDYSGGSLRGFIADVVEPGALVITDGWSGYHTLPGNPHETRVVGGRKAHEVLEWTHRVISNLKRWAMGVYHGLRRKHFQRYLDEFVFRWNRRRTQGDLLRQSPGHQSRAEAGHVPRHRQRTRLTRRHSRPDSVSAGHTHARTPGSGPLPAVQTIAIPPSERSASRIRGTRRTDTDTTSCSTVTKGISLYKYSSRLDLSTVAGGLVC